MGRRARGERVALRLRAPARVAHSHEPRGPARAHAASALRALPAPAAARDGLLGRAALAPGDVPAAPTGELSSFLCTSYLNS